MSHRYTYTEDVKWMNSEENVFAELVVSDGGATIHVFTSIHPGMGNVRRALQELKRQYGFLAAYGVGTSPTDPSWQFWMKMRNEGIIGAMYDDYGNRIRKTKSPPIAQIIRILRKEYIKEHLEGGMFCDINRGMCDSFAGDVQEFFPDAEIMETTQMLLDDHKRLARRSMRLLGDEEDEGFDYSDLMVDYKGHIIEFPTHYWVQYKGKHHDAEQPNGVKDWLNLPIFRRMRKRYNL